LRILTNDRKEVELKIIKLIKLFKITLTINLSKSYVTNCINGIESFKWGKFNKKKKVKRS